MQLFVTLFAHSTVLTHLQNEKLIISSYPPIVSIDLTTDVKKYTATKFMSPDMVLVPNGLQWDNRIASIRVSFADESNGVFVEPFYQGSIASSSFSK